MPGSVASTRRAAGGVATVGSTAAATAADRRSMSTGRQGSRGNSSSTQPDQSRGERSGSGYSWAWKKRASVSGSGRPSRPGTREVSAATTAPADGCPPRWSSTCPVSASSCWAASYTAALTAASGSWSPARWRSAGSRGSSRQPAAWVSTARNRPAPGCARPLRAGPGRRARRAADERRARANIGVRPLTSSSTDVPAGVVSRPSAGARTASRPAGSAGTRRRHSDRLASTPSATCRIRSCAMARSPDRAAAASVILSCHSIAVHAPRPAAPRRRGSVRSWSTQPPGVAGTAGTAGGGVKGAS